MHLFNNKEIMTILRSLKNPQNIIEFSIAPLIIVFIYLLKYLYIRANS